MRNAGQFLKLIWQQVGASDPGLTEGAFSFGCRGKVRGVPYELPAVGPVSACYVDENRVGEATAEAPPYLVDHAPIPSSRGIVLPMRWLAISA